MGYTSWPPIYLVARNTVCYLPPQLRVCQGTLWATLWPLYDNYVHLASDD